MHIIYITFPTCEEAIKTAHILLKDKLIACANIQGVTSIYEWEGEVKEAMEFTMICKTTDNLVDKVIKFVTKNHSYDCPCVIALKIEKGNEDFLKWVENSCNVHYE